ncbi:hypothetical protein FACS1894211_06300 [Clostridia bacterium]|nr:hypothetical protein FACS1894211_06300 [Clostridia bacterium]
MTKTDKLKKFFRNNVFILLFSLAVLFVAAVAAQTVVSMNAATNFLIRNNTARLLSAARAAARAVSFDELETFQTEEDIEKNDSFYDLLKERLKGFAEDFDITYVYYYRLNGDKLLPVIDNDFTEESYRVTDDPGEWIGMEDAPMRAIEERTAVTTALGRYSVGYDGFISAFAPLLGAEGQPILVDENGVPTRGADGRVAYLAGVDIKDDQILPLRNDITRLIVVLAIALVLLAVVGGLSFYFYSKRTAALNRRVRQQELMTRLSQTFVSEKNVYVLLDDALRTVGEFIGASRLIVGDVDGGRTRPIHVWNGPTAVPMKAGGVAGLSALLTEAFPCGGTASAPTPTVACDDTRADARYAELHRAGVKAFIWTLLHGGGQALRTLSVEECARPREWTENEKQLVGLVGNIVAAAVARDAADGRLKEALTQAERASRAKGDFLANMSHEMRTPLNAVIGMTAIAKGAPESERKDYCLNKIEEASTHLLGVINDVLDMSKIEADKFELSYSEFDFEKMLQKVCDVIAFKVGEKRQTFNVSIDGDIPRMLIGDDQRTAQVIANFLSNAVKFTPEGGTITLTARLEDGKDDDGAAVVRVEVADTGIGISAEQKARLFHSFEQADNTITKKFGGTGLGLAISKKIAEMMGGRVWVESEQGNGSTFGFSVPFKRGMKTAPAAFVPCMDVKKLRVLVTDDDPAVLEYFQDVMKRFGILCDAAADGEAALALLKKKGRYDVCFIDYKMPVMDGLELTRLVKRAVDKPVVIMISAVEWSAIESDAKAAGVDKFLAKPLFPSAIADALNACAGTASAAGAAKDIAPADNFSGRRILLAEDVEINREIVVTLLEPTGVAVDSAENGAIALKMFAEKPGKYDMIFMDVQMPEMDGYEATRRIRALNTEKAKKIPIIAMTANVFRDDIEKCLAAGMNAHIGKPLDFDEVLKRLREYLKSEK